MISTNEKTFFLIFVVLFPRKFSPYNLGGGVRGEHGIGGIVEEENFVSSLFSILSSFPCILVVGEFMSLLLIDNHHHY